MSVAAGRRLTLPPGVVHVWPASLDVAPDRAAALERHLSPDERARAERFRGEGDRRRFVVARGWLRVLLGAHLGEAPAALAFAYGPHGKPRLAGRHPGGLRFSLSHSSGAALYAVARDREVGVDLERIDAKVAWEEVVASFFSPGEARRLATLPPDERRGGFFRLWTRREAWLKARGEGLTGPDARAAAPGWGELSAQPGHWTIADERRRWLLADLDLLRGYAAAVVTEDGLEPGAGVVVGPSLGVALDGGEGLDAAQPRAPSGA